MYTFFNFCYCASCGRSGLARSSGFDTCSHVHMFVHLWVSCAETNRSGAVYQYVNKMKTILRLGRIAHGIYIYLWKAAAAWLF